MTQKSHIKNIIKGGNQTGSATNALIMLHGRGGTAEDILSLAKHLNTQDFALYAPQATNNTWYPYSFLSPVNENEPWLSSALELVTLTVEEAMNNGVKKENIFFGGFSQGACLTLEYIGRNATKYGGAIAFTGGLIGDHLNTARYQGDFLQTPIFIGSSDPDMHVPVQRVHDSSEILTHLGANVSVKIYPKMGHTICQDEIDKANLLVFNR